MKDHSHPRGTSATTISGSRSASALALLLVAAPISAAAEDTAAEPPPTSPTSPTSIDVATFAERFENANPGLEAIDAEVDTGRAAVTTASLRPNPALSFEREEVFPDSGGIAENTLTLAWSLDLSGRRSRRTESARNRVRAARARADNAKLAVLIEALGLFYDAAHARLRVDALREGRGPLARMVDALRARVKAGDAAGYDLSRLELELAAYDERVADAQTELRSAQLRLGGLLGEPAERYNANDPLSRPAVPGALDDVARDALASRGDYRATSLEVSSADAALSAADRGWVPLFDIGLGLKTADLGPETATGYVAMISIELPLLSRGQADAERARAHRRVAQARRAQLEREIPVDVRIAHEELASAIERAGAFRTEQLDRAQALVKKAESIYQGGEGSVVELLDAYRTAVNARLRSLALRRRARSAALTLSLSLGRRPEAL